MYHVFVEQILTFQKYLITRQKVTFTYSFVEINPFVKLISRSQKARRMHGFQNKNKTC